jgi:hypothetical protein
MHFFLIALFIFTIPNNIKCWESFEPDLFDLVEEVGKNFYDYFEISQVNFTLNSLF